MTQPHRPDPQNSVAVVIPIRQLDEHGEPVIVRRPGAPRRITKAPTIREADYHAAVAEAAERAMSEDMVLAAASGNDPLKVIQATMAATAHEAAALLFERQRAVRAGRPQAARISSKRVQALCRVGEGVVLCEQLRRDAGDLDQEHLAQAIKMLVETVESVITDVAEPVVADRFMSRLRAKMQQADFPGSIATSTTPGTTP